VMLLNHALDSILPAHQMIWLTPTLFAEIQLDHVTLLKLATDIPLHAQLMSLDLLKPAAQDFLLTSMELHIHG